MAISAAVFRCLDSALRESYGGPSGEREAGEVLKRLLDAGLSMYEPDPIAALARVKAEQRRAAK